MPRFNNGMQFCCFDSKGNGYGEHHFYGPNRENDVKLFLSRLNKEGKPKRNSKHLEVKSYKRIDLKDKIIIKMVYK